jgi:hypothetical protein
MPGSEVRDDQVFLLIRRGVTAFLSFQNDISTPTLENKRLLGDAGAAEFFEPHRQPRALSLPNDKGRHDV